MNDRLPSQLIVDAVIKKCNEQGVFYYILQKGDPHTGTFLVKLMDSARACKLLSQQRDMDNQLKWVNVLKQDIVDEKDADNYIEASKNMDPDQWIFEIETPNFENPFDV